MSIIHLIKMLDIFNYHRYKFKFLLIVPQLFYFCNSILKYAPSLNIEMDSIK